MPAPETVQSTQATFNHVNLMVDSFLANTELDDLRAIVRATLASSGPNTAAVFTAAARKRLVQTSAKAISSSTTLFDTLENGLSVPAPGLETILRQSRSMYGAGMGVAGLGVLTAVVKATVGLRWEIDGLMADSLAAVDADISQAIQSAKEELAGGRVSDLTAARAAVKELGMYVAESLKDTARWGGEFPFERALASIEYWKL
ncbi:hypothetical protein NM688_g5817 [Phlebia brevispora]|uniref:Uncharacterized protein n=1 Tax=Phlebia brevispora TaxID=194682 RepID=A0ACC1SPP3_9APHY|nr:hypothetical protein NM688_g5817 [Phlebia brevispora]